MKIILPKLALGKRFSFLFLLLITNILSAQFTKNFPAPQFVSKNSDILGTGKYFISNIGQYDNIPEGYAKGKILYGYEGMGGLVVFTNKGIVHVQKVARKASEEETEREREAEKQKEVEAEVEGRLWIETQRVITMEWRGANPNPEIVAEEPSSHYYTYNMQKETARGFARIIYKELYPGIDLVFSFQNNKTGIEYNLNVKPGANISAVQFAYGGQLKSISKTTKGILLQSEIAGLSITSPKAFYGNGTSVNAGFSLAGRTVGFSFPQGYDRKQALTVDPFISSTSGLTASGSSVTNASVAKDIDFDYNGNIYVSGGGDATNYKLAKYSATGLLLWVFTGGTVSTTPLVGWNFGLNYGGFVVDKPSGKCYLGQGWNTPGGVQVLRLDANGLYDNYLTVGNTQFQEGWRLIWNCNGGSPQILIAGGGQSSPLDFGVITPPSTSLGTQNITGILTNNSQDIADALIDPRTHELYTLFANGHIVPKDMYKHAPPYLPANIAWNNTSGFNGPGATSVLRERNNRPYLALGAGNDNSVNTLALNKDYLFYWNGRDLQAFSKSTGDPIGTLLTRTQDTALMQGGIIADECGNIFVGTQHGTIKVYKFNGSGFDDNAAPDITIAGYSGWNSVYDLAYDDARRMLYACGRGFVTAIDVSSYCVLATYQITVATSCVQLTASATISPAPPAGSTIVFSLYNGTTLLSSNSSGTFMGLTAGTNYTVKAIVNQECSGVQIAKDFAIVGPALSINKTDACGGNGTITITGNGGSLPYSYSIDGINYQAANNFTGLSTGNYTIMVKDANSCVTTQAVTIAQGTNCVNATASLVNETCGLKNGSITVNAVQGTPPYRYSIDGTNYNTANVFSNLSAGNFKIRVKDATDGFFSFDVTLISISNNNLNFTFTTSIATCGNIDGNITVTGFGGLLPYTYSLDGVNFVGNNSMPAEGGDNYLTIKDAAGCTKTQLVIVPQNNDQVTDAGNDKIICEGADVLLNATSTSNNFTWSPATGISDIHILNPTASPAVTTKYYLAANRGTCLTLDSMIVNVLPAAMPFAGSDTTICYGQSVQLYATGGISYSWSPSTYLTGTNIPNPVVIKPVATTVYSLSAIGANSCPSLVPDNIRITVVYPMKIFAGNDTSYIINEPLQLNAVDLNRTPNITYTWSPPAQLSNPNIANPVFISDHDMRYRIFATTPEGCEASDSIVIKVFAKAEIYVPTGFSPNGDGKNDILKAIPVGIKSFEYFRIYSRWGQLVFTTTNPNKGWDGKIDGKEQKTEVFVWIARGIDYKGKLMERKGTVVLVR